MNLAAATLLIVLIASAFNNAEARSLRAVESDRELQVTTLDANGQPIVYYQHKAHGIKRPSRWRNRKPQADDKSNKDKKSLEDKEELSLKESSEEEIEEEEANKKELLEKMAALEKAEEEEFQLLKASMKNVKAP